MSPLRPAVYCVTAPPLGSSGRSLVGGCRSPADSGGVPTAWLSAPCPEDAVWGQTQVIFQLDDS